MGIMAVMMVVVLALAPGHMGLTGAHEHGQGGGVASQPSHPQGGSSDLEEPSAARDPNGHRH